MPSAFFLQLCPSLRKKRKVFRLKRNTLPPAKCIYVGITRTSPDAMRICSADVRTLRSVGRLLRDLEAQSTVATQQLGDFSIFQPTNSCFGKSILDRLGKYGRWSSRRCRRLALHLRPKPAVLLATGPPCGAQRTLHTESDRLSAGARVQSAQERNRAPCPRFCSCWSSC